MSSRAIPVYPAFLIYLVPLQWRAEAAKLTVQKDADYQKMRAMRDEIKAVESLRKAADRLAREGQHQQKENER